MLDFNILLNHLPLEIVENIERIYVSLLKKDLNINFFIKLKSNNLLKYKMSKVNWLIEYEKVALHNNRYVFTDPIYFNKRRNNILRDNHYCNKYIYKRKNINVN